MSITRDKILEYPDGTWIKTNTEITEILDSARWTEPKPSGFLTGFWWRRKQLLDQLGMAEPVFENLEARIAPWNKACDSTINAALLGVKRDA